MINITLFGDNINVMDLWRIESDKSELVQTLQIKGQSISEMLFTDSMRDDKKDRKPRQLFWLMKTFIGKSSVFLFMYFCIFGHSANILI